MALKFVIDKLEDVDAPIRTHYTKGEDGKFRLATDGDHPKVTEFRDNNVALTKRLAAFDGVDPATVPASLARLAELDKTKPVERVAALEAELATEKTARAAAQAIASTSILKTTVGEKFIKAGGRGSALDYIVGKAAPLFDVVGNALVGKVFDPDRPGEKLTVEGFLNAQVRESDFAFHPSAGGGADPKTGVSGRRTGGANELVDPTPQQLGEHANAIRSGRLKVVYTNS